MIAQARVRELINERVGERNNSEKWKCEVLLKKKKISLPTELFCLRSLVNYERNIAPHSQFAFPEVCFCGTSIGVLD